MTTAIDKITHEQTRAFAEACYNQNSIDELTVNEHDFDEVDCRTWGITAVEWYQAINASLFDKLRTWVLDVFEVSSEDPRNNIREFFNCRVAEIDRDGDIWIEGPQSGHWLKTEEMLDLWQWAEDRYQ